MIHEDEHRGTGPEATGWKKDSPEDRYMAAPVASDKQVAKKNDLDSPQVQNLWQNMLGHYLKELDVQRDNRIAMAEDEAFYDGKQWSSLDRAILEERGQDPLTYNVIKTTVNWVLGTERRGRTDYKILPKRKEGSQAAERKSELLKYLSDTNHSPFSSSMAFADSVKAGIGFLESGYRDEDEGEPIYDDAVSWRDMVWDSASRKLDMNDARYQFRHKWMDADHLASFFPKRRDTVMLAAADDQELGSFSDSYGDEAMDAQEDFAQNTMHSHPDHITSERQRVRAIEAWFRVPRLVERMKGGDFSGEIFDPTSIGHQTDIMTGAAEVRAVTAMQVYVMILTTAGPLHVSKSPYRHNRLPFTPVFCYRDAETMQPYGMIRDLKDMQRDVNKRLSKALSILSSNKTIMDQGAVPDLDEYADEVNRPDAIIVKRKGYALDIASDRDIATSHLEIMSRSLSMIQATSGVTDENLGRETNAGSGKAIIARQEQGALATAMVFDNLRFASQVHGEKMLSLIEQFMTEEKQFRITNKRGTPSYITINDGLPENDIIRFKADFVISEDDWNATIRQSQTAELMDLLQQLAPAAPQIALAVLDLVVEKMDIANREEIVKRIRSLTGQTDPDADPNDMDEEEMARQQAMAEQAEMQKRAAVAELAGAEAKAEETAARAEKTRMETEKAVVETKRAAPGEALDQQKKALDLAIEIVQNRAAVNVADDLLAEAGFSVDPVVPAPQALPPQPAPPPQHAPM